MVCALNYPLTCGAEPCEAFETAIGVVNEYDMSTIGYGQGLLLFFAADGTYSTTVPSAFLTANPAASATNPSAANFALIQIMLGELPQSSSRFTTPCSAAVYGFASNAASWALLRTQRRVGSSWTLNGYGPEKTPGFIPRLAPYTVMNLKVTPGTGYTSVPEITASGGGGSGLSITASIVSGGLSVILDSGGNGYTTAPIFTVTGGGGAGAAITAYVSCVTTNATLDFPCSDGAATCCADYDMCGAIGHCSDPHISAGDGQLNIPVPCSAVILPCMALQYGSPASCAYVLTSG